MKNIIFFSLIFVVAFFCSCSKEKNIENCDADECFVSLYNTIYIKPLETNFNDGVFQVSCDIVSYEEGEAFLLLGLLKDASADPPPDYLGNKEVPFYNYDLYGRAFGNEAKVDGFQIGSYHQVYNLRDALQRGGVLGPYPYPDIDLDAPTFEYPVFVKKINVIKGTVHEKINIRLPDGVNSCWGTILTFRNNEYLEETMKTSIYEYYDSCNYESLYILTIRKSRIDTYYKFFPDSSMFSYFLTDISALSFNFDKNYKYISHPRSFDKKYLSGGALYSY